MLNQRKKEVQNQHKKQKELAPRIIRKQSKTMKYYKHPRPHHLLPQQESDMHFFVIYINVKFVFII